MVTYVPSAFSSAFFTIPTRFCLALVMAISKPVQDKIRVHGKVKERIRQGKSKVKARSRGKFNNRNSFNEY